MNVCREDDDELSMYDEVIIGLFQIERKRFCGEKGVKTFDELPTNL